MKRIVALAAAAALTFAVPCVRAQTPVQSDSALEARTSAVASRLRCPVCQGSSIQESPAELAQQMRDVVREQLRAGRTPDQVEAYFVSKYGEWILLAPPASGFNLLVYTMPAAAVLAGLVVIVIAVRRWTRPVETAAGLSPHPTSDRLDGPSRQLRDEPPA